MKSLRIPSWLAAGMLDRYHAGASHLFLLHGNVRDVQPFGRDYVPLAEGLRRLAARRPILVSYDVSSGLTFPDAEHEKAFRKALGLKAGAIPSDPARALILLDAPVAALTAPSPGVPRSAGLLAFAEGAGEGFAGLTGAQVTTETLDGSDLAAAARGFFAALRRLDASAAEVLYAEPVPDRKGLGHAIADRLARAAQRGETPVRT